MSNAADREVWLNFLDEVDEYLNTIESVLIGIAESSVDPQQMDAALRSAHTIKGIGSMIECPSMSDLAHRFEDSLKIVKVRRNSIQVDAALEMLLLKGLDSIRQISSLHRQALPITESWLRTHAHPHFEKLHDYLGEVQPSDELALLAEESDDSTAIIMFSTEVEELLARLASVLEVPGSPCLREELEMMVEELQDLGRMLQLDAFTSLCQSIHQHLTTASPSQIEPIARQSLDIWQRSQALIMVGQLDKLPTQLELDDISNLDVSSVDVSGTNDFVMADQKPFEVGSSAPFFAIEDAEIEISEFETLELVEHSATEISELETLELEGHADTIAKLNIVDDSFNQTPSMTYGDQAVSDGSDSDEALTTEGSRAVDGTAKSFNGIDLEGIEAAIENFDPTEFQFEASFEETFPIEPESVPLAEDDGVIDDILFEPEPQTAFSSFFQSQTTVESEEFEEILVEPMESASSNTQEIQENTVRVPIRLLTQLNDLFGELIIQRNTMNSRLDQMEDLINLFSQRMVSLEGTNTELQTFCNQLSVDASMPVFSTANGAGDRVVRQSMNQSTRMSGRGGATMAAMLTGQVSTNEQAFDSLEMDRYSDLHLLSQAQRETLVQLREVTSDVKFNMREIKQASSNLNRTAKALQINVTRARMRPLSDIVERFPRTVRDLCLKYGKTVDLKISGGGTLIDRFVAVHLRDPLMHLLRNAFDHGIEDTETRQRQGKPPQGTIEIRAAHRGNQTLISISDDGAGINLTKIRARAYQMGLTDELLDSMSQSDLLGMIFEPGFSTAKQVTNLSGRGIGMDVVRTSLEQIRSDVKVDTQPGIGTTFTISVPFTLSIVRVLLVESGGMQLAFPTDGIEEMLRFNTVQIFDSPDQKVINWQGLTVPLIHLDQWLEFRCPQRNSITEAAPIINEPSILIISHGERLSGIYIDRFWGEREVVIRQVENVISLPPGFSGCTILEDGHVVPLADATKLMEWIDNDEVEDAAATASRPQRWRHLLQSGVEQEPPRQQLALPQAQQSNILVVDDSINMRQLLRTTLEQAGYGVEQGKDGQDAVDQLVGGLAVDAIVCDIEMPRLDGYGVLAEVKADAKLKHLPIIMLTSRGSEKHRQLAMRLGATAYITKPYQDHELLQMIEQVLQKQPLSAVK
ncbi:hybrid sensor histidine kinase/response regulator [Leptothoe sp. PORK10 BA2]|uniref:hybrid sensor histidine kinase/response regulator n=1 Tax=Leptothoe sp. PORK10 BA2 TaxID=3110254 RepID=UPI002B215BBD|nr:response regulator [Leptothoe sp. PORK10 BA2]MEA5464345.1 response regulator [Leptothoe sp. PORK10 BA2]